ncbi:MAG: hypothetical protein U1E42_03760 [Rhodospirillales bacterium]
MDNALAPDRMTAEERLREIGEILATGLLRLRAKRAAEGGYRRETSLDLSARQSVHGRKRRSRERR